MDTKLFLESIGLDQADQKLYLTLLALADAEVSRIAKKADVKRTTAYQILEKLKKLGLISSYRSKNKTHFFAENPNKIRNLFEEKLKVFEKALPDLQALQKLSRILPTARIMDGARGIQNILQESLDNKEKVIYTMGSSKKLKEAIGRDFVYGENPSKVKRVSLGIRSKALRAQSEELNKLYSQDQVKYLNEVRWLPEEIKIPGLFIFWDDKCGFISTKGEGYVLLVESKDFTDSLKSLFNFLWEISSKSG